jgi:hypothetical protein
MSIEKNIYVEQNSPVAITPLLDEVKFSGRVDINNLLARARKEKEKENKENLFFLVLISALIVIFGIILSF